MSRFMEELLAKERAVDVTTIAGPSEAVAEGETVVGVLPDELRALWAVRVNFFTAHKAEAASFDAEAEKEKGAGARGPSPALKARFDAQLGYLEAVGDVFWGSVRYEFPALAGKDNIGVRAGWKVVWFEHPDAGKIVLEIVGIPHKHGSKPGFLDVLLGRGKRPN